MPNNVKNKRPLGYFSIVSIGVGGMIGGGIFAVLGLTVQLAHGGAPLAFLLAGIVALLTTYSYAQLSVTYPGQGGTVDYLNKAFGAGILSGGLNILLCLSYVIMASLYAYAFGSYGASLFPAAWHVMMKHILISLVIILLTIENMMGAKIVGRVETAIVFLKVIILLFFCVVGLYGRHLEEFNSMAWSSPLSIISGGMIIFLAYEGFELIANTAQDVKSVKLLPLAYYSAVAFVIFLYVTISIVTISTLNIAQIIAARDYVLAESAKPFLGNAGFILIAIAALLATGSAINATLYGTARIIHDLAKSREMPKFLAEKKWSQPVEGLLIMAFFTLLIANFFDLSSIAIIGSAGFLLIFAGVNLANIKLYAQTHSHRIISSVALLACLLSLIALIWQTFLISPYKIIFLLLMLLLAYGLEGIYRYLSKP